MTIDKAYRFVNYIANKKQYGSIKPVDFNLLAPQAQIEAIMKAFGNPKTYQNGVPIPIVGHSMSIKTQDNLRPILKYDDFRENGGRATITVENVVDTGGWAVGENMQGGLSLAEGEITKITGTVPDLVIEYTPGTDAAFQLGEVITIEGDLGTADPVTTPVGLGRVTSQNELAYPSDYLHIDRLERLDGTEIDHLTTSEVGNRRKSLIKPPTTEYPISAMYQDAIRIYPDLSDIVISYVRYPVTPEWGYTLSGSNPVYDSATSIQFELPDDMHNEICMLILQNVGVNLSHAELTQYAQAKEIQGS